MVRQLAIQAIPLIQRSRRTVDGLTFLSVAWVGLGKDCLEQFNGIGRIIDLHLPASYAGDDVIAETRRRGAVGQRPPATIALSGRVSLFPADTLGPCRPMRSMHDSPSRTSWRPRGRTRRPCVKAGQPGTWRRTS